jgi:hypothetical protein
VPEPSTKSVPEVATELWALTKGYAKQETVDPLEGGSLTWVPYFIVLIVGCVLIGLAVSRIKKKKL